MKLELDDRYKRRVEYGKYRLDEVVDSLERPAIHAGIAPEQIYKSLLDAIRTKRIKAYLPDSLAPYEPDESDESDDLAFNGDVSEGNRLDPP